MEFYAPPFNHCNFLSLEEFTFLTIKGLSVFTFSDSLRSINIHKS